MSPERLTGLDASFLYMETPTLHMHVAMTAVFDPSTVPGGYSFRRVRQHDQRAHPPRARLPAPPGRGPHCGSATRSGSTTPTSTSTTTSGGPPCPRRAGCASSGDFAADVDQPPAPPRPPPVGDVDRRGARGREDRAGDQDASQHHRRRLGRRAAGRPLRPGARAAGSPPHETERQLDTRIPSGLELVSQAMVVQPGGPFEVAPHALAHRPERPRHAPGAPGRLGQGGAPADGAPHVHQRGRHARRRVAFAAASLEDAKTLKNTDGHDRQRRRAGHVRRGAAHVPAGRRRAARDPPRLGGAGLGDARRGRAEGLQQGVGACSCSCPASSTTRWSACRSIHEGTKGAKEEHKALGADDPSELGRARHAEPLRRWRPASTPA